MGAASCALRKVQQTKTNICVLNHVLQPRHFLLLTFLGGCCTCFSDKETFICVFVTERVPRGEEAQKKHGTPHISVHIVPGDVIYSLRSNST